jgi:hypothetical protein
VRSGSADQPIRQLPVIHAGVFCAYLILRTVPLAM